MVVSQFWNKTLNFLNLTILTVFTHIDVEKESVVASTSTYSTVHNSHPPRRVARSTMTLRDTVILEAWIPFHVKGGSQSILRMSIQISMLVFTLFTT